jgi:stress-induced-phosphoprotein 1
MADAEEAEAEEDEDAAAKKAAEAEKKLGAEAYKKRDFAAAVTHFSKAWETWPKDIVFLTNLAAAYFEQGDYDKSIEACQKAVDEGRELRADYKLVAKAYGRIGSAYAKKDDPTSAVRFFEKSLSEHRTPDILNKLKEIERIKAAADRAAYIDPALSATAREEGNRLFKEGDFAGAVKSYTESIKRDPSDARGYNNRALAYTKLVALPEALKDAEEAIRVDPAFVKAHIRKASVLYALREYTKALDALDVAREHDEAAGSKSTREIQELSFKIQSGISAQRANETDQETLERAMRDPEVGEIMTDPVMQSILQQAQGNPQALQDHMKNPTVRNKISKLINAGIIKTR